MAIAFKSSAAAAFSGGGASKTVTLTWAVDDVVVLVCPTASDEVLSPTNVTGLTFTAATGNQDRGGSDSNAFIFWAKATAAGTGVTITVNRTGATDDWGLVGIVYSGVNTVGSSTGDIAESALTMTVSANSAVVFVAADRNATDLSARTMTTASGTSSERYSGAVTSQYGYLIGDWIGTSSGSQSWGLTGYTSPTVIITQVALELTAAAADSVSDNFNRAEDSSLGANWSVLSATTIGVKTNAAYFGDSWGAGELHVARYATLLNSLDHYSQATTVLLPSTGYGDIRLFARLIDVSNFYYWRINNSSEWYLVRVNGGTETDLQGPIAAGTFSSTDVWKLEVTGTGATVSLKVYKNGTQQGSTYSDTSGSRHVTGAYVGIGGYTAGGSPSDVKIDDFSGGIVTAGSSVTGTAVGNFGFTGTVTGTPDVAGVIASSFGFTGTAIGTPDVSGVAVGNYSFTGTAIGQPGNDGTASGVFSFTATAVGTPDVAGTISTSFGFTGTAVGTPDVAGVLVGNFGFTGTAVGTGGAGGTAVTGTGVGSFGFTGVAVGKRQKWEDYTHNFPGSSGYDNTFFNAPYGDTPTVGSNKMTFPAATSTYSGIQTSISKSLIGSYFLVQLDPRSTGGYSGFSVKDAGTNADILQISYRAQAGVLEGKYYGSNWSDTDSSSTPAFTATTVWFRASESGGIVYLDKYVAGSGWVTVHADTASASALTALANCKIELNCGPFGTAMTTGPSFANINIPPSDNPVGSGNFGFTATAVGTKEVAGTIATNFGFTATARTVGNDITGTAVGSFVFTARVLIPGGATQSMKVWNGSAWLNGVMKVYDGTNWVTGSPRVWDGTNWIPAGGSSGATTGGETLMSVMLQSMTKPHEGTLDGVPSGYDWASGPRIGAGQPATAAYINGWGEAYTSGGNIPANVHVEIRNLKCAILVDGTWSVVQSQLPEGTLQPEGAYFLANFAANESKSGTYIENGVFKGTPHTTPEDGKIWNMHFWTTPRAAIPVGNVDAVACWFEARLAGTGDIANSHVLVGAGVDWYETATTGYLGDACIGHHAFLTGEWTTHLAHSRGLNIATNPPPVALPYNPGVWEFPFNTVKIMPLGDSITGYQATDSTGWTTMTSRLAAQGITITTVGSQTDGYGGLHHEGHGGWCLDNTANACFHPPSFQAGGINDNIVSWLNTYDPQIIVLNAGANDAFTGRETLLGDFLNTCLDLIHATKPNAYVLVARPKSWSDIPNDNAVDIGGRSAEQLDVVAAKQALGYNVRAFNAYTSFTGASTSDWRDYIHPSAQGVGKMMDNTYAAILQLVDLNAV